MKERLVGAAILVGLIVVLVPEMLSGPKDSEVAVPTEGDGAVRTYTIDLTAPGGGTQKREVAPQTENAPTLLPPAEVEALRKPLEQPPPAQSTDATPAARPAPAPPAKPAAPETAPATKPPPRTEAAPSSKPPTGGWAVQIGSFAKSDNAKRVVDELRAKGYPAFTITSGSGASARYKVRVGPQESRAQADKVADRLKRDGRQVAVVSNH